MPIAQNKQENGAYVEKCLPFTPVLHAEGRPGTGGGGALPEPSPADVCHGVEPRGQQLPGLVNSGRSQPSVSVLGLPSSVLPALCPPLPNYWGSFCGGIWSFV